MLDKKISVSEQIDNLTHEAKLIFTWSIPHSDDLGLLPFSHKTLKATVIPMWDIDLENFGIHMESILKEGLIEVFKHNDKKYYKLVKFSNFQTLKNDRKLVTLLDNVENWEQAEVLGFQRFPSGTIREEKLSKEKRSYLYNQNLNFFSGKSEYKRILDIFYKKKLLPDTETKLTLSKFIDYWSEKSNSGKIKWEMQKTFEVERRLRTWFNNLNKWN